MMSTFHGRIRRGLEIFWRKRGVRQSTIDDRKTDDRPWTMDDRTVNTVKGIPLVCITIDECRMVPHSTRHSFVDMHGFLESPPCSMCRGFWSIGHRQVFHRRWPNYPWPTFTGFSYHKALVCIPGHTYRCWLLGKTACVQSVFRTVYFPARRVKVLYSPLLIGPPPSAES